MWEYLGIITVLLIAATTGKHVSSSGWDKQDPAASSKSRVEQAFSDYATHNAYSSAALGVLYGDRLVYAANRNDKGATRDRSIHPTLGLSKTLTAVGILKLAERGQLSLDATVFGPGSILPYFKGPAGEISDPRVKSIRVRHLLHHTGGWDEAVAPVYDPMRNAELVQHAGAVNIAHELGLRYEDKRLDHNDIITYMLGQPLQFQPGTRAKESNFGFCILGRVIEEVSGMEYDYWIQQNVLQPAGMWHTRIGPPPTAPHAPPEDIDLALHSKLDPNPNYDYDYDYDYEYEYEHAQLADSALGWYSNVYDLARLFVCLFKSGVNDEFALLRPETLDGAMRRPSDDYYPARNKHWMALGFVVAEDGSFYLESTETKSGKHVDIFFYHKQSEQYDAYKARDEHDAFTFDYVDDSTVIFIGYTEKHHKHMRGLAKSVLGVLTPDIYLENAFLQDLGDNQLQSDSHDVMVKYKLEEHHLLAYVRAIRMCGYYPTWIHGYNFRGHSYYVTIFRRATKITQLYYRLFTSASKQKMLRFITESREQQYGVGFLQSFVSSSHDDQMTYVVVLTLTQDSGDTDSNVFDFAEGYDNYMMKLGKHEEKDYRPLVQSVNIEPENQEMSISYLLEKNPANSLDEPEARSFIDLSSEELRALTEDNAIDCYTLAYLDTFQLKTDDQPRFSAVFRYKHSENWLLQDDVSLDRLSAEIGKWNGQNYTPQMLVAYVTDTELHFAGFWEQDETKTKEEE